MSWDEAFARSYDDWSAHMTQDVPFYVGLACEADGPIVELGVGNGRVAIPVAKATGRRVVGIDTSPAMLEEGRRRADEACVELDFCQVDGERQDEPVPHRIDYAVGDDRIDLTLDDGSKSSLWWATKNEWLGLIDVAGLEVENLYGGFADEPLTDPSREYVFVARRPWR